MSSSPQRLANLGPLAYPQAALDLVASGVVVLDEAGGVIYANPSATALLQSDRDGSSRLDHVLRRFGPPALATGGAEGTRADTDPVTLQVELSRGRIVECTRQVLPGTGYVLTLVDVSLQAQAVRLAHRDPLTDLANRTELRSRLAEQLATAGEAGSAVAVLCLDLDRFKAVNDTLGHAVGDALLRKVADRLRAGVRSGDLVARMGGDEFAVMLTDGVQVATADTLAGRLVDLVGRSYAISGHILDVGVSIGIALAPADGTDPGELLKKADLALYRAKAEGRGTHRFYEAGMDAAVQTRRALEFDLRKALALREFRLAYQPQVELETSALSGFEALLRWVHPERGQVSPADFIPLAEELGLIIPIGEWVLSTACRAAASWPAPIGVAVNLSPVQFRSPRLVERVAAALAEAGLEPSRLELEITEGALITDTALVLDVLNRVRSLGVRVSMDDFGTGYSSLAYLQSFPFDRIKIDQSFVRGSDDRTGDHAIVRAIAGLGASLGIRTTAEGVETPEQLERVRRDGCTEVQGYLTGRPLPPEQATILAAATLVHPSAKEMGQ